MPSLLTEAARLMGHPDHELFFSAVNLWEIVIKRSLGRDDFKVNPRVLRRSLRDKSGHAVAVDALPSIHKDPFDRLLVAQAMVQGITLLTADEQVAKYPGPIRRV
jgi:PIN domain nuclease of toxin-antitoxin system